MSGRPDSDVERALASFGGLTMRYHSFGPAPVRPAGPGAPPPYEDEEQTAVSPSPYVPDPNERAARVFPLLGRAMPEADEVTVSPDIAPPPADEPPPRQSWAESIEATEEPDSLAPVSEHVAPHVEALPVEPTEATSPETLATPETLEEERALPSDTDAVLTSPHAHLVETPLYEPPSHEPPTDEAPIDGAPAHETPVYETPVHEPFASAEDADLESIEEEDAFFAEAVPLPAATPEDREAPLFTESAAPTDAGEPFMPEPGGPEFVMPEPLASEPLTPEPLGPEPLGTEPLGPEPLPPEPFAPEPFAPEPLAPPLTPEPFAPEPLTPEPFPPMAVPEPPLPAAAVEPPAPSVREAPPPRRAAAQGRPAAKPLSDVFRVLKADDTGHPPPVRPQKSDLRDMFRRL